MADNYLENKFEKMKEREAAKARARQEAYRKRMEAYRRKIALEVAQKATTSSPLERSSSSGNNSENPSGNHSDKE